MIVFKILINSYVQYNFCVHMSRVTSSQFAKYVHDIYCKYIAPCMVMIYATSDAIWVMPRGYTPYAQELRSSPTEWIIL
jgi:hypothetical protein